MAFVNSLSKAAADNLKRVPGMQAGVRSCRDWMARLIPDSIYARRTFHKRTGSKLNLRSPATFNEKIQWIKLHHRTRLMTHLADKFEAREYVRQVAGEEHLIPLIGVWKNPKDIPFRSLPGAFVLKATHGCAWNILCEDADNLDVQESINKLESWLSQNYYHAGREWVYKNIPPRVIAEEFLFTSDGTDLKDYKFFCFHGEPEFIQVDVDRHTDHRRCFYDKKWSRTPFTVAYPHAVNDVPRPDNLPKMLEVARRIAKPFPFARVDLYSHEGRCLFGEVTFYPGNGMELFDPPEFDRELGRLIDLGKV